MIVALIILASLVGVGSILYIHERIVRRHLSPAQLDEEKEAAEHTQQCCGMHLTCEKDSLSTAISTEIVYYDDEELDRFADRDPRDFSSDEIEQFRDIMLTLIPSDIAGWARSLQLRNISLPPSVKDELLLIVSEARLGLA